MDTVEKVEAREIANNEYMRKRNLAFKAKEAAVSQILKSMWMDKISSDPSILRPYISKKLLNEDVIPYLEKRGGVAHKRWLVTINPEEGVNIKNFLKKINKAMKKKYVTDGIWCVETRGVENNKIKGIHCHMAFNSKKKKKRSEIHREFYNTFKNLVGNMLHVHVKYGKRPDAFITYVQGIKDKKLKEHNEIDVKFRELWDIKPYVLCATTKDKKEPR